MAKAKKEKPYFDVKNINLEEWLSMVFTPEDKRKYTFIDYQFPSDFHASEYLASACTRPESEIKYLIRYFLIPPGVQGYDHQFLNQLLDSGDLLKEIDEIQYIRRLFRNEGWEGMTWILDLLPDSPMQAIDALDAFIKAHVVYLSDGRLFGLCDAISIIRHKYILSANPRDILSNISPRDFEFLISALFRQQKYKTRITKQTRDGGADITCTSSASPIKQTVLVECKHYTGSIGVEVIRQLAGVVSEQGATSGWVVTSGRFSSPAVEFASQTGRIQLMDYTSLNLKLNECFGARWSEHLSSVIAQEQRKQLELSSTRVNH